MTHTHERTPIMASELQPGDFVYRGEELMEFVKFRNKSPYFKPLEKQTIFSLREGLAGFPPDDLVVFIPTITELVNHLIRNVDPDRRMTSTVNGDVITLEYITKIYKPKHADPTLGEDKEPEVAEYRIIVDSNNLPEQIELALQEIESKEVEYE